MKFSSWLILIVLGAFILRAWNLSAQSLDMDELAERQVHSMSYQATALRADSMPPLYRWCLKAG